MRRQINEDELDFFFTLIGRAVWHLQYVESSLGELYLIKGIIKEPNAITESEALKEKKKIQKKTLGQLLHAIKEEELVSDNLQTALDDFNQTRKWIVHKSLIENGADLYTSEGRELVFNKLNSFYDNSSTLQKMINHELMEFSVSKGGSMKQIENYAKRKIAKLKGEV